MMSKTRLSYFTILVGLSYFGLDTAYSLGISRPSPSFTTPSRIQTSCRSSCNHPLHRSSINTFSSYSAEAQTSFRYHSRSHNILSAISTSSGRDEEENRKESTKKQEGGTVAASMSKSKDEGDARSVRSSKRETVMKEIDQNSIEKSTVGSDIDTPSSSTPSSSTNDDIMNFSELGDFDPSKKIPIKREVLVGDPQLKVKDKEMSVSAILQELAAIQQQGPRKYCILGTRHCSYLHQQIIELLSYALVLSENHVYTSGAGGTNAAAIRGALRAERPDLLTVILPQSLDKQPHESQDLLRDVTDLISMPQNDEMSLDVASRLCNSKLLSETDQLIAFAFHESRTVIEATKEAKKLEMLVTMLFLD